MSTLILVHVIFLVLLIFTRAETNPDQTESNSQRICYTVQAQGPNQEQVPGYLVYPPYPVVLQFPPNVQQPKSVNPTKPTAPPPTSTESKCKWKRVLKAASGNGRDIYVDWAQGSARNDNEKVPEAREIQNDKIYRASSIIDTWDERDIDRVRIEVFKEGVQVAWLLFNGVASNMNSWMSKDRLIASSYEDMKSGGYNHFSAKGDDRSSVKRRFYIARTDLTCVRDCGLLLVTSPISPHRCDYERIEKAPAFYYSRNSGCAIWTSDAQRGSGDRFVISVRDCVIDQTTE